MKVLDVPAYCLLPTAFRPTAFRPWTLDSAAVKVHDLAAYCLLRTAYWCPRGALLYLLIGLLCILSVLAASVRRWCREPEQDIAPDTRCGGAIGAQS